MSSAAMSFTKSEVLCKLHHGVLGLAVSSCSDFPVQDLSNQFQLIFRREVFVPDSTVILSCFVIHLGGRWGMILK